MKAARKRTSQVNVVMDLRCLICNSQLPSHVSGNELFIQAACPCGWVAPVGDYMIQFLKPDEITGYDDVFLEWPRKTKG